MFNIIIDEAKCTSCMACEIACSYHHKKVFDPGISSIEIHKHGEKEESISIILHKAVPDTAAKGSAGKNGHLSCDYCQGENEPLCVRYCASGAVSTAGEVVR